MICQRTRFHSSTSEAEDGLGGGMIVVGAENCLAVATYPASRVSVFMYRERHDDYDPFYSAYEYVVSIG